MAEWIGATPQPTHRGGTTQMSAIRGLFYGAPMGALLWVVIIMAAYWIVGCATPPPPRTPDIVEIEVPVPVMSPFDCQCQCEPHKELELEVMEIPSTDELLITPNSQWQDF